MNVTAPITPDEARTWTPPQGHADIAPSRFERIEGDGYLTSTHLGLCRRCCGRFRSRAGCWSRPPAAAICRLSAPRRSRSRVV